MPDVTYPPFARVPITSISSVCFLLTHYLPPPSHSLAYFGSYIISAPTFSFMLFPKAYTNFFLAPMLCCTQHYGPDDSKCISRCSVFSLFSCNTSSAVLFPFIPLCIHSCSNRFSTCFNLMFPQSTIVTSRQSLLLTTVEPLTNDHPHQRPSLSYATFRVTDCAFCLYTNPSRATIPLKRPHQCDSEGGRIRGILLYDQCLPVFAFSPCLAKPLCYFSQFC